jgi:hypothetical protein
MTHTDYQHCIHKSICPGYLEDDTHCKLYLNHCKLARCLDDEGLRELIGRNRRPKHDMNFQMPCMEYRRFEEIL